MLPEKFEDWTFNNLVTWATWEVIAGITKGDKLETTMWAVVNTACAWREDQRKKEKRK